jgi:hypothetical protein
LAFEFIVCRAVEHSVNAVSIASKVKADATVLASRDKEASAQACERPQVVRLPAFGKAGDEKIFLVRI